MSTIIRSRSLVSTDTPFVCCLGVQDISQIAHTPLQGRMVVLICVCASSLGQLDNRIAGGLQLLGLD